MEVLFSLPVILGITLFIGIVVLVKLLLSPKGAFERRSFADRRITQSGPAFPFYDSERNLVEEDRRKDEDRRSQKFIITINKKGPLV